MVCGGDAARVIRLDVLLMFIGLCLLCVVNLPFCRAACLEFHGIISVSLSTQLAEKMTRREKD
jgi:hypothetical protein